MSWFGKMVGGTVGLMIGGPLGAIAGGAIGHHLFDKKSGAEEARRFQRPDGWTGTRRAESGGRASTGTAGTTAGAGVEERQATYFLALFSLLGKLAKADGAITREEGEMVVSFLDRMGIRGEQRQFAIKVFNEAKNSRYSETDFARQFAQMTAFQPDLRSSLLDMLFQVALADGEFHPQEQRMIEVIAGILGMAGPEFENMRARYAGGNEQDYAVLGLSSDADDETVKAAYRRLVQEYHPDRIISQGMPQEFVEYATQRFQEIQSAWDSIKQARNL